jgi:hypothetical protein
MKSSGTDRSTAPAPEQRAEPPELAGPAPAEGPAEVPAEVPAEAPPAAPELTDRERDMLAFESRWWKRAGAKEQAIRDAFDLSATRYYQVLNGLLDNPAALAHDPVLVARLRRLRSSRARGRTATPPA